MLNLMKKKRIKIFEVISDKSFRKVRGGKESTLPSKQTKKQWQR